MISSFVRSSKSICLIGLVCVSAHCLSVPAAAQPAATQPAPQSSGTVRNNRGLPAPDQTADWYAVGPSRYRTPDMGDVFRQRLKFYADRATAWASVTADLSAEQRADFQVELQLRGIEVAVLQVRWEGQFADCHLPTDFNEAAEYLDCAFQQLIDDAPQLSAIQRDKLRAGWQARKEQRQRDMLAGVTFLLDRELYLSSEQLALIEQVAPQHLDLDGSRFLLPVGINADTRQTSLFRGDLGDLLRNPTLSQSWTEHQSVIATILADERAKNEHKVLKTEFEEIGSRVLEGFADVDSAHCLVVAQMKLDLYRTAGLGSRTEFDQLSLYARQCADAGVADWRKRWVNALGPFFQRLEDDDADAHVMRPWHNIAVASPEWIQFTHDTIPGTAEFDARRTRKLRWQLAAYFVGLVDREIWLTPRQHQWLLEFYVSSVPDAWIGPPQSVSLYRRWCFQCAARAFHLAREQACDQLPGRQQQIVELVSRMLFPESGYICWLDAYGFYNPILRR